LPAPTSLAVQAVIWMGGKKPDKIDIDVTGTMAQFMERRRARLMKRFRECGNFDQAIAEEEALHPAEDEARRKYLSEVEFHSSGDFLEWAELEIHRMAKIGRKSIESGMRGGKQNPMRDMVWAREYLRRRPTSRLTKSALMSRIGAEGFGGFPKLGRSAAIDAINRGLKKIVR
jgi:hypothetical protein